MASNPFESNQIMESVVLDSDAPVFEDVQVNASVAEIPVAAESRTAAIDSVPVVDAVTSSSSSSSSSSTTTTTSSYSSPYGDYQVSASLSADTSLSAPSGEPIPIDIFVTDPEKLGDGMNSFVTYRIRTHTTLPNWKDTSIVVRRFSDFIWFHEQLRAYNKGTLIPSLPEKAIINRFSPEFIETRRKELEKFLNRVAQHHVLHQRPQLAFFLQSSDEQFAVLRSKTVKAQQKAQLKAQAQAGPESPTPQQGSGGGGGGGGGSGFGSFFSAIGQSISNVGSNLAPQSAPREIDQWFEAKKNYLNALEKQLDGLLKYTSKLVAKRKELAVAQSDFSVSLSNIASAEAETDNFISNAFVRIAQIADHIRDLIEQLFKSETTHFEEALRDYHRVIGAVKDMLDDRDEVLLEYQNASRALEAKKEKAAKGGSKTRNYQLEIDEAQKKVDDTKMEYEAISARVKSEMAVFDATRAREIRRMLSLLVQANMENSLQVVDLWKGFIAEAPQTDEKDYKLAEKIGWGGVGNLH